jgi:hypothetical protein
VLPPGYEAAAVEIAFHGKAPKPDAPPSP